jgi:hypothetical protein
MIHRKDEAQDSIQSKTGSGQLLPVHAEPLNLIPSIGGFWVQRHSVVI